MVFACYAQTNPIYQPAARIIQAITQSNPAVVTTTFAHLYKDGVIVRFDVPAIYGMQQINQETGTVRVITDTTFYVDIDSTLYSAYSIPGVTPAKYQCPQVVPIGEVNLSLKSAVQNTLPH